MNDLTILHNPRCSTSRHAVDALAGTGGEAEVVHYLRTPLDREQLLDLLGKLEDPAADLVRKDAFFTELGLSAADHTTPEQVADLLAEHPRLMQRPVLVRGDRAIIGRPKSRADDFLAG
ncbi:ArsC/Spx/MgsR family protein [Ornithinimicrobium avium]|uniref:Arsenate reductase n=1 Tax=Ornithinimicrobium avium TaxID=2283195 RepID=A0A345NKY7_9MICO|nr:ArsC/Spx/MgsR family protein [Ornithinimicrobium avium]AXH95695.1 arsenate reductase [Ornithinimicrobium avium]